MMAKILVVEDNPANAQLTLRRLARKGHEVSLAVDGLAALRFVEDVHPDLVLLDLNLPGLDGWECARRLREGECTASLPIIALSAHAMAEDRLRALAVGCDAYFSKPVDYDALDGAIRRLVVRRMECP